MSSERAVAGIYEARRFTCQSCAKTLAPTEPNADCVKVLDALRMDLGPGQFQSRGTVNAQDGDEKCPRLQGSSSLPLLAGTELLDVGMPISPTPLSSYV